MCCVGVFVPIILDNNYKDVIWRLIETAVSTQVGMYPHVQLFIPYLFMRFVFMARVLASSHGFEVCPGGSFKVCG